MDPWFPPNTEHPPPKAGEPPLHRAARVGDLAAIRELASQGIDLNDAFDMRLDPSALPHAMTPLMVAAGSGDGASLETVDLLLELGADPTIDLAGNTAASFACTGLGWNYRPGGDAQRLRRLLEAGSPLPSDPSDAHRLLHDVAEAGDAARLEVLLQNGLNANGYWDPEQAKEDNRVLMEHLASTRSGDPILDAIPKDLRDEMNELEQEMFGHGATAPYSHEIPVFGAAQSGSIECLNLLLEHGADLIVRDNSAKTAMYYATSELMVRALMAAGLPLEDEDEFGGSPLDDALSSYEPLPRISALIAAGADVNATHDHGYTVFMSAVGSERNLDVLKTLVAAGADPHAVSEYGYNAFHAAIDVNGEANAEESVRETLTYLKELGLDIEARNRSGQTPLARAISVGTGIEVRVLCELGADVNAVGELRMCGDQTCTDANLPMLFHVVLGYGVEEDEKTAALLEFGANPGVVDAEGYRPVDHAIARLCTESKSREKSFAKFFEGAKKFESVKASLPPARQAYIEAATTWFRRYLERFASHIPVSDSIYGEESRSALLATIAMLCGYEAWLRTNE